MGAFSKCAECRKCCNSDKGGPYLARSEHARLKELDPTIKVTLMNDYLVALDRRDGKCPFLDTSSGCVLSDQDKPLSCEIWPFYPTSNRKWIMRMSCPYWYTITQEQFEFIKATFKENGYLWENYADVTVE